MNLVNLGKNLKKTEKRNNVPLGTDLFGNFLKLQKKKKKKFIFFNNLLITETLPKRSVPSGTSPVAQCVGRKVSPIYL